MRKVKKKKLVCIKYEKNTQQIIFVIYKCLDIRLISFRVTYHPT